MIAHRSVHLASPSILIVYLSSFLVQDDRQVCICHLLKFYKANQIIDFGTQSGDIAPNYDMSHTFYLKGRKLVFHEKN